MTAEEDDIHALLAIIDRLLSPGGCAWDREQTPQSWARMVFEESCEVLDTLSEAVPGQLADEVGDVAAGVLFLAKAAAAEKRFSSWAEPFKLAAEKLRRRHPHIFANETLSKDPRAVEQRWDEIKATEAHHKHRTSRFDGIPASLPALALMQKLVHKANKAEECADILGTFVAAAREDREEEVARRVAQIVVEAENEGIHVEHALRNYFGRCRAFLMEREPPAKKES